MRVQLPEEARSRMVIIVNWHSLTPEEQEAMLRDVEEKQPGAVKFIIGPWGRLVDIRR